MTAKIARVKGLRLIDLFLTKCIQLSTVFFSFLKFFFIHLAIPERHEAECIIRAKLETAEPFFVIRGLAHFKNWAKLEK